MKLKTIIKTSVFLVIAFAFTMIYAKKSALIVSKGEARVGTGNITIQVSNGGCSDVFYDPSTNIIDYSCDAKTEPAAKTKLAQLQQFYKNAQVKFNKGKTVLKLKEAFNQPDPKKEVYYSLNGAKNKKNEGATIIIKREKTVVSITIYLINDEEIIKSIAN